MLVAIAVYLALTVVIGASLSLMVKSITDYLIAGQRGLGLPLATASLAAVQIGAGVILGGAETGAKYGLWPGTWYEARMRSRAHSGADSSPRNAFAPPAATSPSTASRRATANIGGCACGRGSPAYPGLLGIFAAQLMACGSVLSGLGFPFNRAVLAIRAVILVSNAMSGMWGVVAHHRLHVRVVVIVVGIPVATINAPR
ncbi:MAG: hypothetical protein U0163_13590 [Gemmatimonadaceae bacterium]